MFSERLVDAILSAVLPPLADLRRDPIYVELSVERLQVHEARTLADNLSCVVRKRPEMRQAEGR